MDDTHPTHAFDYVHDPNWRIFRIMAEFVDGFDFLSTFEKTLTVFGSTRTKRDDPYYFHARDLCSRLGAEGFAIITGGGPGIMEAANEGARIAGAVSAGLNIQLSAEQRVNPFVDRQIGFEYFFTRKVMLSFASQVYIFFPGGYGTLDELFEVLTLIQTKKIEDHIPVVLFGKEYWQPLCDWLSKDLLLKHKTIEEKDLALWTLTDDIDEVVQIAKDSKPRTHR